MFDSKSTMCSLESKLKVLWFHRVLFLLENTLAFLEEVLLGMLDILTNELLNLRRLLKSSLKLGQENIFNCSQLFLELVLLLARLERVKSLKVLQEYVANKD